MMDWHFSISHKTQVLRAPPNGRKPMVKQITPSFLVAGNVLGPAPSVISVRHVPTPQGVLSRVDRCVGDQAVIVVLNEAVTVRT